MKKLTQSSAPSPKIRSALGGIVIGVVALLAGAGIAPANASTVDPLPSDATVSVNAPKLPASAARSTALDPAGYWTAEKLANAIDSDPVQDDKSAAPITPESTRATPSAGLRGVASLPVAPLNDQSNSSKSAAITQPRTMGKLFYTYAGQNHSCSASVINSGKKNLIETAAHCVYEGGVASAWHTNITFAPSYYNGLSATYGLWNYSTARTFNSWVSSKDFSHDQAFVALSPRNGQQIVNVVGGNGLGYGYGTAQVNVRVWGYPADPPYNGSLPYSCNATSTYQYLATTDSYILCDLTGGASGGPWVINPVSTDLGTVFAVTSRRADQTPYRLYATPNTQDVKSMFDAMG